MEAVKVKPYQRFSGRIFSLIDTNFSFYKSAAFNESTIAGVNTGNSPIKNIRPAEIKINESGKRLLRFVSQFISETKGVCDVIDHESKSYLQ